MIKTRSLLINSLRTIGLVILMIGVYKYGYHNGLEFLRKNDSGLGGLGEIIEAIVLIAIGIITITISFIISFKKKK
ncbi:hypothetical protein [Robertkochia flava]|uniref:hypothetical protein n=1 Tax=Robertkochia flava TaxID=3447986 RepID=UPI001CCF37EF|nr:hypothetical protein [Robertkochia marina]